MKTIDQKELIELRDHLLQKPFKYEEVFREVLDHYATAFECSEATLKEVIAEQDQYFLNSRIVAMNERYEKDVHRALRKHQLSFFTNYLKWPNIVFTLIFLAVFWSFSEYIHENEQLKVIIFYTLALTPVFIWMFFGIRFMNGKRFLPWTMGNAHMKYLSILMNISFQTILFTRHSYQVFSKAESALEISANVTSLILLISFVLLSTTLQLALTRIKPHVG